MTPYIISPEDKVIIQDDIGTFFYFIAQGECRVEIKDSKGVSKSNTEILKKGNYFGEIALIYDCKRSASVVTTNYCTFAKISKEKFLSLCKHTQHHITKLIK